MVIKKFSIFNPSRQWRDPVATGQFSNLKKEGFTLIEIMVVATTLVILNIISVSILFAILRASIKTEMIKNAKQDGNYALSIMERMIRNAKKLNSVCTSNSSSIEIVNPDALSTTFSFTDVNIASVSAQTDNLISSGYDVSDYGFDCVSGDLPSIAIYFTLSKGAASLRTQDRAKISFKTTVSLRNIEN